MVILTQTLRIPVPLLGFYILIITIAEDVTVYLSCSFNFFATINYLDLSHLKEKGEGSMVLGAQWEEFEAVGLWSRNRTRDS